MGKQDASPIQLDGKALQDVDELLHLSTVNLIAAE
jgi:hypothetical protein